MVFLELLALVRRAIGIVIARALDERARLEARGVTGSGGAGGGGGGGGDARFRSMLGNGGSVLAGGFQVGCVVSRSDHGSSAVRPCSGKVSENAGRGDAGGAGGGGCTGGGRRFAGVWSSTRASGGSR